MSADTNRLRVDQDGLFTNVEHAVLAKWFRQRKPAGAARIRLDDALAQLGFEKPCDPYSRTAAAVAHVVLEAIEDRLPVWACRKDDKLITARSYREPASEAATADGASPERTVRDQLGLGLARALTGRSSIIWSGHRSTSASS